MHTVFDPLLIEEAGVKLGAIEGLLYYGHFCNSYAITQVFIFMRYFSGSSSI